MIFEASTAIYVAMAVALSVWVGIFAYLWRIDSLARELRRKLDSQPDRDKPSVPTATLRVQQRSAPVERKAEKLVDQE